MKKLLFLFTLYASLIINAQISDFAIIDFSKADNIAKLHEGESLNNLPLLTYKLTHNLDSDVEKFRAIFLWVCQNIKADYLLSEKIIRTNKKLYEINTIKEWQRTKMPKILKKLFHQKKTVCTGYAYLIKKMANLADIDCELINGYGKTAFANVDTLEQVNHSWNAVKLHNKWYLCDATWASGYTNENYTFVKDYNNGYFLTTPDLFAKNHFPEEAKWLLNAKQTKENFVSIPLAYNEAFKHRVIPISPEIMNITISKNKLVNFKLSAPVDSLIKINVIIGSRTFSKLPIKQKWKADNDLVTFNHSFKSKGVFDVHLQLENDIIATYVVNVE